MAGKKKHGPAEPSAAPPLSGKSHVSETSPAWIIGSISAAQFKARCLQLMDDVQTHHAEIVITKRGRPVAKLVPVDEEAPESFGFMRGTVRYHGDIVAPDHESWADDGAD